jgi:DNA-binding PadR family transcriptional regulator
MARGDYLGEFEQVVLLAVARLGGDAYGMRIRQEIEQRTGRAVTIGAVYATLDRLEVKGHVRPRDEPGGRARRFFDIQAAGVEALETARQIQTRMWAGLRLRRSPRRP